MYAAYLTEGPGSPLWQCEDTEEDLHYDRFESVFVDLRTGRVFLMSQSVLFVRGLFFSVQQK